jgi:hypothetical protein
MTDKVKLLVTKHGTYTVYVFENVKTGEYIMCTRLPNWQCSEISGGDIGYLEYKVVNAGDTYFDVSQNKEIQYAYSNVYFINFIQDTEMVKQNEIIL